MAEGANTVGDLYLRLGLSYDELNQDFVQVEETLKSNLARLNRDYSLISIQADIDLTGVTDIEQKLQVETEKLTKQIEIQTQKLKLYEAAWIDAGKQNGYGSQQAQKAAIALKNQEFKLAQLTQRLKELTQQQKKLNAQQKITNTNSLIEGYNALKGRIPENISSLTNSFSKLKEASGAVDGAITKTLESISNIPAPVAKAAIALVAIPTAIKAIENSLIEVAKPAIASGDSLYVLSRGLQMSVKDTAQLSTICKVTGIEISEVTSAMRRLNMQLVKSDSNLAAKTLKQYGVSVRNANGELKNALEMSLAIAGGLSNAQAEGKGKDFIAAVLGRSATGDLVTFFEDLAGNVEQAKKVIKNGLADPTRAHAIQGELNTLNAQAEQLSGAFSTAFMPLAEKLIPNVTERLGELTKVISENSNGIKEIAEDLGTVIDLTSTGLTKITELGVKAINIAGELKLHWGLFGQPLSMTYDGLLGVFEDRLKAIVQRNIDDTSIKSAEDLLKKELQKSYTPLERIQIENNPQLYQQTLASFQPMFKALDDARNKAKKKTESIADAIALSRTDFHTIKGYDFKIDDSDLEDVKKEIEHTRSLQDELYKLTHDNYENRIYDLNEWRRKILYVENATAEQRLLVEQIYAEKSKKIEEDRNKEFAKAQEDSQKRTQDLIRETFNINYGLDHSPFEKQIQAIKQWEQESLASLEKYKDAIKDKSTLEQEAAAITANALAKEREAFEREMDRIKGRTQSLKEKIFELEHSQRDIDIMRAQKERAELYQEGIYSPEDIERLYEDQLAKIRERSRNNDDYIKTPKRARRNAEAIPIINGDESDYDSVARPQRNFYDEIQRDTSSAMEKFGALNTTTQELADAQENLKHSIETFNGDELISSFTSSVDGVVNAQDSLSEAFLKNTQLMQDMSKMIEETKQKLSGVNFQQATVEDSWINKEAARVAFDAIENAGGAVALAGAATVNPMLGAVGGGLALFGGLGNMALDTSDALDSPSGNVISSVDTSAINDAIKSVQQEMTQLLNDLTQTTLEIAQNVQQISQREPPQPSITVSPNINIDLGGAYVFDEAMKQAIVDDVATKTTDAIKDTFQNEVRSSSYGYGN